MSTATLPQHHPNIMFSHFGFAVKDLVKMEDFYTRVLDFTVTDRGNVEGMGLVFLSRDPHDHHQIILASGKPDGIPPNPYLAQFGSVRRSTHFRNDGRSAVAPPTEISRRQHGQPVTGDLWYPHRWVVFEWALTGLRVGGATSPT